MFKKYSDFVALSRGSFKESSPSVKKEVFTMLKKQQEETQREIKRELELSGFEVRRKVKPKLYAVKFTEDNAKNIAYFLENTGTLGFLEQIKNGLVFSGDWIVKDENGDVLVVPQQDFEKEFEKND